MALEYEYLFLFVFLGAGLKIIDDIYDIKVLDEKSAYLLAPLLVLSWTYLSMANEGYAAILGAILLSSILTGKVDNSVFKLSATALIAIWLLWGINVLMVPLILLTLLGVLDELLDGYGEREGFLKNRGMRQLLRHRLGMKFGVVILYLFAHLELMHVLALFAFDIAYEIAPASLDRGRGWIRGVVDA